MISQLDQVLSTDSRSINGWIQNHQPNRGDQHGSDAERYAASRHADRAI